MTATRAFASRNTKELLRDPASLLFSVGLPLGILVLMQILLRNIGQPDVFSIENFSPGIAVFGLAFVSLFSSMLIARDRASSFLTRLFASPLPAMGFILGYSLPLIPMALAQCALCFAASALFGLALGPNTLLALLVLLAPIVLFVGIGLLLGTLCTEKNAGPITSVVIQVVALSSGMWFPMDLVGGVFRAVCYAMPFAHAYDAARFALAGRFAEIWGHLGVVAAYAAATLTAAVLVFRHKMKSGKK